MPHRTGCAQFRQIAYDQMGGKEGNDPTIFEVFKKTRERKSGELDKEAASKLEEIIEKEIENPEFSAFELVEECFGLQNKGHVTCFGFGMKPKGVRGALPSRVDLQTMLRNKEKENGSLHSRLDKLEEQFQEFVNQQSRRDVENVDNAENVAG